MPTITTLLLHRYPLFRASNREEFREALITLYGASAVEADKSSDFRAWVNNIAIGDIALSYAATNTRLTMEYPETEYVRQQIGMRGRSVTSLPDANVTVDRGQACTTSLGRPMRVDAEAGHERLTLRIKTEALERKLAALLGTRPKTALEFEPALDLSGTAAQQMNHLLRYFMGLFDTEASEPPAAVLRELEQALIVSFLAANEHPYSRTLTDRPPGAAPRQVRLAEEFIEAHWREAITIERLVEATGISARVLFRAFRQHRGCTPMEFAKQVRLQRARQMLSTPAASVTAVAFACGFLSTGHFARAYREAFGELPSETIRRFGSA
jgi:AraC-like DNA-binding protein